MYMMARIFSDVGPLEILFLRLKFELRGLTENQSAKWTEGSDFLISSYKL